MSSTLLSYGVIFRKPPWSISRSLLFGTMAGFGGSTLGRYLEVRAHSKFIRSLEDRDGFITTLSNVHTKMTGTSLPGVNVSQSLESVGVTMGENDTDQNRELRQRYCN